MQYVVRNLKQFYIIIKYNKKINNLDDSFCLLSLKRLLNLLYLFYNFIIL